MNQEIVVPAAESAKKLENFLKARFPIGYVRKLFRKNGLRVNGQRSRPKDPVRAGDRIQLYIPFEKTTKHSATPPPVQSHFRLIFEDETLLVINKPAGIAVHEGKQVLRRHSVIGLLKNQYREQGVLPKLVHRLDKDTSGVLVIAKDEQTGAQLEAIFAEEKNIDKEYVGLLAGRLQDDHGTIDFPLPGREGKPVRALTRFQVLDRFPETTLVRVNIETGRMHQIRLHFAEFGYPVVLDDQHGDFKFNRQFRKIYGLRRQFLHACRLGLDYGGKKRVWTAPLPKDLQNVLDAIRAAEKHR
ncbi:MAG: RluA family pseudouridine synthase [Candidatus Binatia bacterium]